jgi:hypothetical protein
MPLKLVAASKEASAKGKAAMSPTRKSPSGVRALAMLMSVSDGSSPLTVAPRCEAR